MSIKFLVLGGGVFWVLGGGGECRFYFMGARIFLTNGNSKIICRDVFFASPSRHPFLVFADLRVRVILVHPTVF